MAAKELISTITVGAGGAASIDFTSIPNTYTDLLLVTSLRTVRASNQDTIVYRLNSATNQYLYRQLYGANNSVGSDTASPTNQVLGIAPASNNTSNTFSSQSLYIPNYTSSVAKSMSSDSVSENNATTNYQIDIFAGSWSGTSAITSISLFSTVANLAQYSTASLYGINRGSGGASVA